MGVTLLHYLSFSSSSLRYGSDVLDYMLLRALEGTAYTLDAGYLTAPFEFVLFAIALSIRMSFPQVGRQASMSLVDEQVRRKAVRAAELYLMRDKVWASTPLLRCLL
jgi:hypothetical protein